MKKLICILLILLYGCSEIDSDSFKDHEILGFYEIDRFYADELADLNQDGISSNNFKNELLDFFNDVHLKITKLPSNGPFQLLFSIYLPYPNEIVDKPYGHLLYDQFALFKRLNYQKGVLYSNEYDSNDEDKIFFKEFEIVEESKIKFTMVLKYYDFDKSIWKDYKCYIIYSKKNE